MLNYSINELKKNIMTLFFFDFLIFVSQQFIRQAYPLTLPVQPPTFQIKTQR